MPEFRGTQSLCPGHPRYKDPRNALETAKNHLMGLFDKLKQSLQKTKQLLQTDVRDLFKAGEILDDAKLERFESKLIQTDMGVDAAGQIVGELRRNYLGRTVVIDDVWATVKVTL